MSSILKALKKLEDDTAIESAGLRPDKIYLKKTLHQRGKSNLRFGILHLVVLTALVIAVGGGLIFKLKPWEKAPEPVVETEIKAINLSGKKILVPEVTQKQAPTSKITKKPEAIKPAKIPSIPTKPKKKTPAFAGETGNVQTKLLSIPDKRASLPHLPKKETVTRQKVKKPLQNKETERLTSLPFKRASETRLELQAIAWASDPESRIAVINGNVIHEGESVDRVIVVEIGKNEVAFSRNGVEWQQLFRHK